MRRKFQIKFYADESNIYDAQVKIDLINEATRLIPEHVDITAEIDKLLKVIASNKDKLAVLRQDYGTNQARMDTIQ